MITKANFYFLFIVNLTCAQWFTLISITLVWPSEAQVITVFQVTLGESEAREIKFWKVLEVAKWRKWKASSMARCWPVLPVPRRSTPVFSDLRAELGTGWEGKEMGTLD